MKQLKVENINVYYDRGLPDETHVLKDLSFTLKTGTITLLNGRSGSGKTTLFKSLLGEIKITSGNIITDNEYITNYSFNKRIKKISTVFQDTLLGTCPNLSVKENIQLVKVNNHFGLGLYNKINIDKEIEFLTDFGLEIENKLDLALNKLSGGQKQIISFLLAKLQVKPILLLDEFTSALDNSTEIKLLQNLSRYCANNNVIILTIMHNHKNITKYLSQTIELS